MSELNHELQTAMTGEAPQTISLRLPKLNWQIMALMFIAVIAAFQTYQLSTLKGSLGVRPTAAATSSSSADSGSGAGLKSMVGGC